MYDVLMPVDTNVDRALAQAEYIANLPGAADSLRTHILFVFTEDSSEIPDGIRSFKSASRVRSVRRANELLEEAGVETILMDIGGDTVEDITSEADDIDADQIVMGGRKRSPVGKAVFGSVTQQVILNTERPVVVVGSLADGKEE